MSGTYLYLIGTEARRATAELIESFQTSQEAFENQLRNYWATVGYPYEAFLADSAAQFAADRGAYLLAHSLLVNRPEVQGVFMEIELDMLLLDGAWLPSGDLSAGEQDSDALAFRRAMRNGGLRVAAPARRIQATPGGLAKVRQERRREFVAAEAQFFGRIRAAGLSAVVAEDLILINRLCNRTHTREDPVVLGFPMWIVSGWDNYEGYLTGAELQRLTPRDSNGFLSLFMKLAAGDPEEGPLSSKLVDRLGEVRARAASMGPDTLCVAVSSL